jgi:hypothetical protein
MCACEITKLFLDFQKEGPVLVFHVKHGMPMRIDDHEDLVFSLTTYAKVGTRGKFTGDALANFSRRFPGHSVTTAGYLKQFIMDMLLRSLWPWRTCFVYCFPNGGRGPKRSPLFHQRRKEAMERE